MLKSKHEENVKTGFNNAMNDHIIVDRQYDESFENDRQNSDIPLYELYHQCYH